MQAVIHPGQVCRTPDGRELHEEMHQGVRSWGNSATGATVLLTGAYAFDGEVGGRLLRALPPVVVLAVTSSTPRWSTCSAPSCSATTRVSRRCSTGSWTCC